MSEKIAKKYVNALIKSSNKKELNKYFKELSKLSSLYSQEKYLNIISSPDIKNTQKENFILSLNEVDDQKFINFLKLLCQNSRLDLIPLISEELRYQVAVESNKFDGVIISDFAIAAKKIKTLEESFSKKFDSTIKLSKSRCGS